MFPGHYSEIFGLGERLGCILNLGHSFDAIEASLDLLVCRYTLARFGENNLAPGTWDYSGRSRITQRRRRAI